MNGMMRGRLGLMMFLEYVIYGAWLPLLGLYLGEKYLPVFLADITNLLEHLNPLEAVEKKPPQKPEGKSQ